MLSNQAIIWTVQMHSQKSNNKAAYFAKAMDTINMSSSARTLTWKFLICHLQRAKKYEQQKIEHLRGTCFEAEMILGCVSDLYEMMQIQIDMHKLDSGHNFW